MLELRSLSRRYGDRVALDAVSFTVPDGRIVGLLGANGAQESHDPAPRHGERDAIQREARPVAAGERAQLEHHATSGVFQRPMRRVASANPASSSAQPKSGMARLAISPAPSQP